MTDPVLVFDIVAAVVGTGGALHAHHFRLFRRIQRIPRRRIAELHDGMRARVLGTVREHDGVIGAGMTGRSTGILTKRVD